MLRAADLTFAYEGQASPYVFSLFAAPGEVTAVSGASGSGKSTLLDLLAGFLRPTGGSLDLDGADLIAKSPEDRPISLLLQTDNLFDHLSAADNAALGLPAGISRQDRKLRVSAALSDVGLGGLETRVAAQLSGGQKQRVALARTLLRNRPVLLLDEPFSALDDETRRNTRAMVLDMTRRQNWHTVLVSHHQDDIEALARRHYRLAEGRLVEA